MSAPPKTPITRDELVHTNVAMFVLTSSVVFARAILQISRRKPLEIPDFFIYFAYVLFVSLWSCYITVVPPMFKVYAVIGGEMKPYATMMEDAAKMLRLITAGQMCFYTLLLSVKMSLLTLYRKLLVGLPSIYGKIWWGIFAFCVVSWVGSILSTLFACSDLNEKFSKGKCGGTPNEDQRIIFSLYFAYSVDITTDLAIMILPIRLVWNLQMAKGQKIGVLVLFGSGFICISFATLRVVLLGVDGRGKVTTPEPKWMLFWTVLECSMVILIGCSPAFAVLIRKRINNKKASCNAQGYARQPTDDIRLENMISSAGRSRRDNIDMYWGDRHSSQEELAKNAGHIVVKTTVRQSTERVGNRS